MKVKRWLLIPLSILALLALHIGRSARAQTSPLAISWWSVSSGTHTATDGVYTLSGNSGQAATTPAGGDGYSLESGYWAGLTYAPVQAAFVAKPAQGRAPLIVDFRNRTSGDFDTCTWTFGDGQASTGCGTQRHTYTTPGEYTVSLQASGLGGSDVRTRIGYVVVEPYQIFLPMIGR